MLTNQKISGVFTLSILALLALSAFAVRPAFASGPLTFHQCPPVGADPTCKLLINIDSSGTVTVLDNTTVGPYENVEDTLVGVQDNCVTCGPISTLSISGPSIFGLDGDGACTNPNPTSGLAGAPAADCLGGTNQVTDPATYESNNVTFTIIDASDGVLHFSPPLTGGTHAWFSLEEPLTATSLKVGPPNSGAPEFNLPSIFVAAISLVALALYLRIKRPSALKSPSLGPA